MCLALRCTDLQYGLSQKMAQAILATCALQHTPSCLIRGTYIAWVAPAPVVNASQSSLLSGKLPVNSYRLLLTLKDENASDAISKLATSTRWKNSMKFGPFSSILQVTAQLLCWWSQSGYPLLRLKSNSARDQRNSD